MITIRQQYCLSFQPIFIYHTLFILVVSRNLPEMFLLSSCIRRQSLGNLAFVCSLFFGMIYIVKKFVILVCLYRLRTLPVRLETSKEIYQNKVILLLKDLLVFQLLFEVGKELLRHLVWFDGFFIRIVERVYDIFAVGNES